MDVTNPGEPLDLDGSPEDEGWLHGAPGLSPAEHKAIHDTALLAGRIGRKLDAENKRLGTGIYGPHVHRPAPDPASEPEPEPEGEQPS